MNKRHNVLLITLCVLGMGGSFAYYMRLNPDIVGEIKAPVFVNVEIDKNYARNISLAVALNAGSVSFELSPTTDISTAARTVVLYHEIKYADQTPFIRALYLRLPEQNAAEYLNAAEGISVFIGNKLFYFSRADIASLRGIEQDGYILYHLPGLRYERSFLGSWLNWYGDLNLAVKTAGTFLLYPLKFIITWFFLCCFLLLCGNRIVSAYYSLKKRHGQLTEAALLALILAAAFFLRFNGYARYSSWGDELYAAHAASNPGNPFFSTFEDPGNPPLYYILLRLWFTVFGWTEPSGRMLSVLLGSGAVLSIYILVRRFAGRNAAVWAALFMTVNNYLIGFSQEIKAYSLELLLVPFAAYGFLIFTRRRNWANFVRYLIPAVLLANTHFYGAILIFVNFLFFVHDAVSRKDFCWKKTLLFLGGNVFIACSLLPFFIHTALRQTLFDISFNSWIRRPGFVWKGLAALVPLLTVLYLSIRKIVFPAYINALRRRLMDYLFFTSAALFLVVLGISLSYRSILLGKYLIILFPFMAAGFGIVSASILENVRSKAAIGVCAAGLFICILAGYETDLGGTSGVYQECEAYIARDAESHPEAKSVEFPAGSLANWVLPNWTLSNWLAQKWTLPERSFYGNTPLPLLEADSQFDTLYFKQLYFESTVYSELGKAGISADKAVKIRVNELNSVFKVYR